jgi:protein-tyrosine kinase
MTVQINPAQLIERAAARLRGGTGLVSASLPAPEVREPASTPIPDALPNPDGVIGLDMLARAGMARGAERRTRIAEELSVAAGNLLRAARAAQATEAAPTVMTNLVMVTSPKPNEGKSFSSLNLAVSLAHHGLARVLLVDIDPKPGSLSALVGVAERPGLFDLAANAALKPEGLAVRTAIRDLSFMPIGVRAAIGAHHGITRPMAGALERIARRFAGHIVMLDAPPCLATSEPAALAPMVGMITMVVEAERTQREELEHALDLVKSCPNIVLVLNKLRGTIGHDFGDYDYYGA